MHLDQVYITHILYYQLEYKHNFHFSFRNVVNIQYIYLDFSHTQHMYFELEHRYNNDLVSTYSLSYKQYKCWYRLHMFCSRYDLKEHNYMYHQLVINRFYKVYRHQHCFRILNTSQSMLVYMYNRHYYQQILYHIKYKFMHLLHISHSDDLLVHMYIPQFKH